MHNYITDPPHVSANFECENSHPSVMIILDIDMLYRGVGALDQMVRLINIHVRVVEILLWHPSS